MEQNNGDLVRHHTSKVHRLLTWQYYQNYDDLGRTFALSTVTCFVKLNKLFDGSIVTAATQQEMDRGRFF